MSWVTALAYYVLFWWLTLFAVLSVGLRTQDEEGEITAGTPASAPSRPRLLRTLGLNTLVSGVVFGLWYYVTQILGYGISSLPKFFG